VLEEVGTLFVGETVRHGKEITAQPVAVIPRSGATRNPLIFEGSLAALGMTAATTTLICHSEERSDEESFPLMQGILRFAQDDRCAVNAAPR
jgi:hypothetical protein